MTPKTVTEIHFLKTNWTTTSETSGDVMAYLIHEPTSKTGSTRADFGGAIDVQIEFEVHENKCYILLEKLLVISFTGQKCNCPSCSKLTKSVAGISLLATGLLFSQDCNLSLKGKVLIYMIIPLGRSFD